jgi:hypothetical protein
VIRPPTFNDATSIVGLITLLIGSVTALTTLVNKIGGLVRATSKLRRELRTRGTRKPRLQRSR